MSEEEQAKPDPTRATNVGPSLQLRPAYHMTEEEFGFVAPILQQFAVAKAKLETALGFIHRTRKLAGPYDLDYESGGRIMVPIEPPAAGQEKPR